MNVRLEIEKYAADEDKEILSWLFDRYHMESQWRMMAFCTWKRYGNLSYESNRVWVPTPVGRMIYGHAALLEAVEFYASDENWRELEAGIGMSPAVASDFGHAAKAALKKAGIS